MAIEIIDRRYGESKKTLQDVILLILAKEFPLTIGEIAKKTKKDFKIKLTFQAIRKSILTLMDRKILGEKDKKFYIKKTYILETKSFSDQLLRNYYTAERENALPTWNKEDMHEEYVFDNLLQADKFWGEVVLDWARNIKEKEEKEMYFNGPFCWYPFGHLGTESDFLQELRSHRVQCYYVVDSDSKLDEWIGNFYKDNKTIYITSKEIENKTAMCVFGNYTIQFGYPDKIYNEFRKIFKNNNSIKDITLSKIANLLKKKEKIKVIITNNKAISEKLGKEIKSRFKEVKK